MEHTKTDILINVEHSVLGAVITDNDSLDLIDLKPHEYVSESHQIIFAEIVEMLGSGRSVDVITLAESLQSKGQLDRVGELKYIGSIVESCRTSKNITRHACIIRKAYQRRQIKGMSAELEHAADEGKEPEEIIELAESKLLSLVENNNDSTMAHLFDAVVESIELEDREEQGLMTGIRSLDQRFNGLKNSDLIILAARPSMGKTSFAMQISEYISSRYSVLVFSLEMPKRQIAKRMLKFHENRIGKSQAIAHLKNLNFHIDDKSAITLQHVRSQCRKIKRQHGLDFIVIDYLQLMHGKGDNRNQEIGSISRGLKSIAKEFDIPVLVLSQLNRKLEDRADKRPVMSDLRESGEIEQDADIVMFIYRDEVYDQNSPDEGLAEIITRKYRNGSIGTDYTEFDGANTRFKDTKRRPENRVRTIQKGFIHQSFS